MKKLNILLENCEKLFLFSAGGKFYSEMRNSLLDIIFVKQRNTFFRVFLLWKQDTPHSHITVCAFILYQCKSDFIRFFFGMKTGWVYVRMVGIRIMVKMFSSFFLFVEREQRKMVYFLRKTLKHTA